MKIASNCPLIDVKKTISNDSIIGKTKVLEKTITNTKFLFSNIHKNKIFVFVNVAEH